MPSLPVTAGFSSMLNLAILTLPFISFAISSSEGAIIRQGPHHSAQKSTTTGSFDFKTSLSKLASVTLAVSDMATSRKNTRDQEPALRQIGREQGGGRQVRRAGAGTTCSAFCCGAHLSPTAR